jgi:predicted helicase
MTPFGEYLAAIRKNLAHGDATEHTHRSALEKLLETVGDNIEATNEPTRISSGAPDFNITRGKVPLGHVETKDIGTSLDAIEKDGTKAAPATHDGKQFKRYRAGLPNWILTDYLEFRWFVNGEKCLTARLAELDSKGKLHALPDGEAQSAQLLTQFFKKEALTVGTAKDLAQRMAGITHIIRDLIIGTFGHEQEKGWLHNWLAAFREVLIPDLDEPQFADMFAQTIAYGLFAACVNTPAKEQFSRQSAAYAIPKTNPFLRKLFSEIAGVDMPDAIAWAVDDLVNLLRQADMAEILRDFGKGKGKEDPVVHFYETFLAAYDPKMREVRGVYYTPEPVVSYIVRSIDHLLKTRFDRPKGLADENTLILDPATGTATFLYFVIDQIYQKFTKQKGAWDSYVDKHLLNRIFGFELLMAPYAIAHFKLARQLQDSGYSFGSDQRLGIYLTNTLEEAAKKTEQLFAQWIAEEANAAAKIKSIDPILVVLGNPPYSGHSANRSTEVVHVEKGQRYLAGLELEQGKLVPHWKIAGKKPEITVPNFIGRLLLDYYVVDGAWLDEKNPKWLQDDYVKFIRFAQWRVEKTGYGVIGYITNHSYLDNPTFRGMRQSLMQSFNEIYVYDLHGNAKKKERAPDGGKDENVFDIQQGVAILLCVKKRDDVKPCRVNHADMWGEREIFDTTNGGKHLVGGKYHTLWESSVENTNWKELTPASPFYLFVPRDAALLSEYEKGFGINDAMPVNSVGIATARDGLTIHWTKDAAWETVQDFAGVPPEEARSKYHLGKDVQDWKVEWAQEDLKDSGPSETNLVPVLYRPFDVRFTYYTGKPSGFHCRPRREVMAHMLAKNNIALITSRLTKGEAFAHAQVTRNIVEVICMSPNTSNNGFVFPLYLIDTEKKKKGSWSKAVTMALFEPSSGYHTRRPNYSPAFLKGLAEKLKLPQAEPHGLPKGVTPEDIFHYAYAVFHSPTYRTRYAEFLKIDFPRLPLTSDLKLFRALAAKGAELVALHLMESKRLNNLFTTFPLKGSDEVEKVQYTDNDRRVWINPKQYFGGVPKNVWEFHIGGYQVCEKWLKDRKGRKLSYDDIQHYQKIVVALHETIRLMAEIDKLIPAWPIA